MQNDLAVHSLAQLKRLVVTGFSDESEALENIETSSSILLERGPPFLLRTHSLLQRLKGCRSSSAQTDQRYFDVEISSCSREERSVLPLLVTVAAQEVDGRYQTRIEPLKSYFATLTGKQAYKFSIPIDDEWESNAAIRGKEICILAFSLKEQLFLNDSVVSLCSRDILPLASHTSSHDSSTILKSIRPGQKSFRSFFPVDINVVHYCCILSTEVEQLNKFPVTIDYQEKSGMKLNKAHLSRRTFDIPSRDIYHIADIMDQSLPSASMSIKYKLSLRYSVSIQDSHQSQIDSHSTDGCAFGVHLRESLTKFVNPTKACIICLQDNFETVGDLFVHMRSLHPRVKVFPEYENEVVVKISIDHSSCSVRASNSCWWNKRRYLRVRRQRARIGDECAKYATARMKKGTAAAPEKGVSDPEYLKAPLRQIACSAPQFFHSKTGMEMTSEDIAAKTDSDDEIDLEAIEDSERRRLDDLIDIADYEKEFMKMWNMFTVRNPICADSCVPDACRLFADENKVALKSPSMRFAFTQHLILLFDVRLLDGKVVYDCLRKIDDFAETNAHILEGNKGASHPRLEPIP